MTNVNGVWVSRDDHDSINPFPHHEVLDALLKEYKECEERIRSHEKEDPLILYYVKQSRLKSIGEAIKRHSDVTETLKKRVMEELNKEPAGENGRVVVSPSSRTLRSTLIKAGDATKLPKVEQEMIAKQNQLEIATTELEMLFQEKAILESDIQELKVICANLTADYKRQEEIAGQLSVNSAGRGEVELLDELANVETRRIKISEVHERWKEARVQLADSCRQFSSALMKWREIKDDSVDNQYETAEEVRDELITSLQFLANAKFYIQHDFPYCTKQEMAILTKALTYIFVDMRAEERRHHAGNCYAAFHNRAVALYAWVDTTLKAIIQPVVLQTAEDLRSIMEELQEVRFQSIKHQFPNVSWQHASTSEEESRRKERSNSTSPSNLLADKMSGELLQQLDLSQLAPLHSGQFAGIFGMPPFSALCFLRTAKKSSWKTDKFYRRTAACRKSLQIDHCALPRTVDIFGKPTEELVESYKTTLRESMARQHGTKLAVENNLDELVQQRKESLAEKDLAKEDSIGLA